MFWNTIFSLFVPYIVFHICRLKKWAKYMGHAVLPNETTTTWRICWYQGNPWIKILVTTVCPRGLDQFHIVGYYMNWVNQAFQDRQSRLSFQLKGSIVLQGHLLVLYWLSHSLCPSVSHGYSNRFYIATYNSRIQLCTENSNYSS